MTRRDPFARCVVGASLLDTRGCGVTRGYTLGRLAVRDPRTLYAESLVEHYVAATGRVPETWKAAPVRKFEQFAYRGNRSKFGAEVFASARVSG